MSAPTISHSSLVLLTWLAPCRQQSHRLTHSYPAFTKHSNSVQYHTTRNVVFRAIRSTIQ